MTVVRIATPDDFQELARIYRESTFARLPEHHRAALVTPRQVALAAEHALLIVAEVSGVVVGGIGISARKSSVTPAVEPGEMQAFWYGVDPQWQGRGIGGHLMSAVVDSVRNTGDYTRLVLQILESRPAAIKAAQASGAVRKPDRGGVNEDGDPYSTFEIDLKTNKEN